MLSFISLIKIIKVVIRDLKMLFWITASVANAAAVNPTGVKTLLTNGFSTFLIKDKIFFSNGPKSLPKNPADCPILCDWVFDNFMLVG